MCIRDRSPVLAYALARQPLHTFLYSHRPHLPLSNPGSRRSQKTFDFSHIILKGFCLIFPARAGRYPHGYTSPLLETKQKADPPRHPFVMASRPWVSGVIRIPSAFALSLIHISEPTRLGMISYAVFCLK